MTSVPCGSCHLCCKLMTRIMPDKGDDPSQYRTMTWVNPPPEHGPGPLVVLERRDNGDCVYLDESGCTIHDRAPFVCRDFDCRAVYKAMSRKMRKWAVRTGRVDKEILDRGRELAGHDAAA